MEREFFLLFSAVATGSGFLVVLAKNPIHSALALVTCFVQIAALFILLGSPFLAVIQIFVYVGAIMVLFLFVIMMLDVRKEAESRFLTKGASFGFVVILVLAAEMFFLLTRNVMLSTNIAQGTPINPSIKELGLTLFSEYLLPFEVASVILLVALIGAVVLAKTEEDDTATKDELASGVEN